MQQYIQLVSYLFNGIYNYRFIVVSHDIYKFKFFKHTLLSYNFNLFLILTFKSLVFYVLLAGLTREQIDVTY